MERNVQDLITSLDGFTWLAIAAISVVGIHFHVRWSRRFLAIGPTFLTTLGILFCFLGIAIGLRDFDPDDVKNSVPSLLDGIRTSFWASVAGILWALTLKGRSVFLGEPRLPPNVVQSGATVDDLANHLARLNRAIAGDDDSTLLTQLKLLRGESKDGLERLNRSFDTFAERMTEANSKALIEALSSVIRDFNQKLNEQFGENFKQLNAAVEKLVVWQIQYEQQLNQLIQQETATRASMTDAASRYGELVNKAEIFAAIADSMTTAFDALNARQAQLESGLRPLSEMITKAADGLPQIDRRITEMVAQLERGFSKVQADVGALVENSGKQTLIHNQQLTNLLSETLSKANKELNTHIQQSVEDSKKQIVALDRALEVELQKALESLGRQLAALSARFVEDYTPLTDRLQKLVANGRL